MKRYVLAHWRGELSLAKSFLVNGVLAFVLLRLALAGIAQIIRLRTFGYPVLAIWFIWETWAVVGIVRCALRTFREPRSTLGPFWARRGFAVVAVLASAAFVYGTIIDIGLLLR